MKYAILLLFVTFQLCGQKPASLPRSTPEAEGVSSEGILDFLEAAAKSNHEFHSFMVLRHGKVVAEGWWNPYRSDLKHTLYSCSKSFAATAIGFAVAEKRLTVEDKVVSFFPEDLPATMPPYLAELRVKDLLSMSVGHEKDPTSKITAREEDWVKAFFAIPIVQQPGTKFLYNSSATFMLSAIVQKLTGEKIIDYLKPRLFDPLGITGMDWENNPDGINVGGWGLRLKTEDMAKFGQLFLQKGVWKGKQILPAAWVEEATTMKILQDPNATQGKRDSSDWLQGYCYQMWRSRNNSYRGDGAFGQYILVFPEKDAVIAITSETPDMQAEFNLIWKHLFPAIKEGKLPANPKARASLSLKTASLALPKPEKSASSALESKISGQTFGIFSSDNNFKNIRFEFKDQVCRVALKTDSATHVLSFGLDHWAPGQTTKYGPYLVARAVSNRVGLAPFQTAGSYTWKNEKTLELTLRYIESPHTETITCSFEGDYVSIDVQNLFNKKAERKMAKGVMTQKHSNPPRLIIRGDDMGFSHSANEALIKCYKEGIQTSIEVIVPSPWFPEAVKLLELNPGIDVGLHFAITSEWDNIKWRPLTDCPSLRNEDGYFYQMLYPNSHYPQQAVMNHDWKLEDIEKEMRAQIEMALKYIPRLSHVSGHMNSLAFDPKVQALARKIGQEYNLTMVDVEPEKDIQVAYTWFDARNKTPEEKIQAFIKMLDGLEAGKTYVYVEHPGFDNEELRAIYHIGYEDVAKGRQDVTDLFTSEQVKEAIIRKGIELVSYKEVIDRRK